MKILVTGSSGLVGSATRAALEAAGHTVLPLVRPPRVAAPGEAAWDRQTATIKLGAASEAAAVVNLAGASIADGRWSDERKRLLRASRIDLTRALVDAFAKLDRRPRVLVSASAVGYYGDRGDEQLDEDSTSGKGFLAQLAIDWEAEAMRAETLGVRTVLLRFGMILSRRGGALAQLVGPFRLGAGGRLGSGRQWMAWVAISDVVGMIETAIANDSWRGAYNCVAPEPVTNAAFTKALGRVLHRPTLFPVPRLALRTLFGEMADEMLLASQRAVPKRALQAGYAYSHPGLEPALQTILTSR